MLEKANKLNHLAVIMDGNRRWAKHNNLNIKVYDVIYYRNNVENNRNLNYTREIIPNMI